MECLEPVDMSNGSPPVTSAPVPPSVAGIVQPVMESGPGIVFPDFTPAFPPPALGSETFDVDAIVVPAPVPPSVAGIPRLVTEGDFPYEFPDFSTTFPEPTVVFANVFLIGADAVPMTTTTQNVEQGGWAPGAGPQMPVTPPFTTPPLEEGESEGDYMTRCIADVMGQGADETTATDVCQEAYDTATEAADARSLHHGDAELPQRSAGAVLQSSDADKLHQPKPPTHRRRKRVPPRNAPRNPNR
jgi:hypothetical protein